MKAKTIVTGGCGFIGSNLVDRLVQDGHEVLVIDYKNSKSRKQYFKNPKAEYCSFDLAKDPYLFQDMFDGVDWVFHMAAEISVQYCVENPRDSLTNNINSTVNVLDCARKSGVKKVVFSSTCAVYGNTLFLPSVETNRFDCLNTYSISKHTGEELCRMYSDLYGLNTTALRYFNVYGERQPESGPYAPVMGIFFNQKQRNEPLTIVGEGYQTRDFVHVSDVVEANLASALVDQKEYGEVYNVGTGVNHSIENIANMISPRQIHLAPREGEVMHSRADIKKIKDSLGWEPKVNLEDWINKKMKTL